MAGSNGTATTLRVGAETSAVVGNTPLVALPRLAADLPGEVVAKLEFFNPGGSVKDRIGVAMIDAAERDGLLEPGRSVIVEPTSGHTRTALLRTYGAEVHETPSLGGMNEAVELANRLAEENGGFIPQQFSNPANPE